MYYLQHWVYPVYIVISVTLGLRRVCCILCHTGYVLSATLGISCVYCISVTLSLRLVWCILCHTGYVLSATLGISCVYCNLCHTWFKAGMLFSLSHWVLIICHFGYILCILCNLCHTEFKAGVLYSLSVFCN